MCRIFHSMLIGACAMMCPVFSNASYYAEYEGQQVFVLEPPEDAVIQDWEVVYDDYRTLFYDIWHDKYGEEKGVHPEFLGCVLKIKAAIVGDEIYIGGLFRTGVPGTTDYKTDWRYKEYYSNSYPWIKGIIRGTKVIFEKKQPLPQINDNLEIIGVNEFTPCAYYEGSGQDFGNTFCTTGIIGEPTGYNFECAININNSSITLETIIPKNLDEIFRWPILGYGFSNHKRSEGIATVVSPGYGEPVVWHLPIDKTYKMYLNVSFRRAAEQNGVDGIATDSASEDPDAPVYDITGRRVDASSLSPGIYIRNGRKFIAR